MPLGTEVGLVPGDIALEFTQLATPFPETCTAARPLFGPCLLWPNGRPSQLLLRSCLNCQVKRHIFERVLSFIVCSY